MDKKKIQEAVKLLLEGIGEDVNREGLHDTPDRIALMCEELFGGMNMDAKDYLGKTFTCEQSDMVLEKDIMFYSMCEHHLLPFYGKAHIAYIPDGRVVGLSKLARTVEVYARRPQIQEHMTSKIAEAIMTILKPKGVMVRIDAQHLCMSMRGVKKPGSVTSTYTKKGVFETDRELQRMFMEMIR